MKILIDKYPMGSFKGQKSPGRYIDGYLHDNLSFLANKIAKDMTFMGVVFSSTLEVGTGKSVFVTQMGEAWTEMVNKTYKLDIKFTAKNLVFNPKDLIERAFELPKYSCIILDEWEDATYWSELGVALRQFFRKCRQLNLFMIVICPNWFQFPMSYAISRSIFSVDVKFEDGLERGYFDFYDFSAKKYLYIKGKKFHNYKVQRPTFQGRFTDGYGIPEKEYRLAKLKDMIDNGKIESVKKTKTQERAEMLERVEKTLKEFYPDYKFPTTVFAKMFEVSPSAINDWRRGDYEKPVSERERLESSYNKLLNSKEIIWNDEELEQEDKKERPSYVIDETMEGYNED